jgi:hypothetical protein
MIIFALTVADFRLLVNYGLHGVVHGLRVPAEKAGAFYSLSSLVFTLTDCPAGTTKVNAAKRWRFS